MNLSCFSQTDTVRNNIILSEDVARKVVKDLIKLDGCEEEILLYQEKLSLVLDREEVKDSVIQLLTIKDKNNQTIITLKDEQLNVSQELINNLKTEIERRKTSGIFYKIGTAIGVISLSILIGLLL